MVSINDVRAAIALALSHDEGQVLDGGPRCGRYLARLLDPSPINPRHLRAMGAKHNVTQYDPDETDYWTINGANVYAEVDSVWVVESDRETTVTSMGALELELARIELAREIEEQGNADGK